MSIFSNFFDNSNQDKPTLKLKWTALEHIDQLDKMINDSHQQPVLVFKHSTRYSISRMALKNFENEFGLENQITLYFLDLLNYRTISNEIATVFKVEHQSPQIILIKNGVAVFNASHSDINADELGSYI